MKVVKANGGPDDLVQNVKNGSIETTQELMRSRRRGRRHGGGAMLKSAYSSGKPSFGSEPGTPVIVDTDVDFNDAATNRQRRSVR
jgi:succinate-semialdehyde dehydrogenase